jgi:hypothetical protein
MSDRTSNQSGLAATQAAYDSGRYEEALVQARALERAGDDQGATRLRCLAAYRLGELDDAACSAERLVSAAQRGGQVAAAPFDVLGVSVVAAGELARFDQCIEHLRLMQSAAARAGSLAEFVRGRGAAATAFALLGDLWAGQRLLSELAGMFQTGSGELRLEATVRTNHASVCLQIARMARQGQDAAACDEALDHAAASLERTREIARDSKDLRIAAFADVHAAELALLRSEPGPALVLLDGAVQRADSAGLWAHSRQLRLLEAEALLARGDVAGAHALLDAVASRLNEGHELSARIRFHSQMQRVLTLEGDSVGALAQLERARTIAQYRQYRQAHSQSRYLRARLELEHMYRFRPGARKAGISRPGALGDA